MGTLELQCIDHWQSVPKLAFGILGCLPFGQNRMTEPGGPGLSSGLENMRPIRGRVGVGLRGYPVISHAPAAGQEGPGFGFVGQGRGLRNDSDGPTTQRSLTVDALRSISCLKPKTSAPKRAPRSPPGVAGQALPWGGPASDSAVGEVPRVGCR